MPEIYANIFNECEDNELIDYNCEEFAYGFNIEASNSRHEIDIPTQSTSIAEVYNE